MITASAVQGKGGRRGRVMGGGLGGGLGVTNDNCTRVALFKIFRPVVLLLAHNCGPLCDQNEPRQSHRMR